MRSAGASTTSALITGFHRSTQQAPLPDTMSYVPLHELLLHRHHRRADLPVSVVLSIDSNTSSLLRSSYYSAISPEASQHHHHLQPQHRHPLASFTSDPLKMTAALRRRPSSSLYAINTLTHKSPSTENITSVIALLPYRPFVLGVVISHVPTQDSMRPPSSSPPPLPRTVQNYQQDRRHASKPNPWPAACIQDATPAAPSPSVALRQICIDVNPPDPKALKPHTLLVLASPLPYYNPSIPCLKIPHLPHL